MTLIHEHLADVRLGHRRIEQVAGSRIGVDRLAVALERVVPTPVEVGDHAEVVGHVGLTRQVAERFVELERTVRPHGFVVVLDQRRRQVGGVIGVCERGEFTGSFRQFGSGDADTPSFPGTGLAGRTTAASASPACAQCIAFDTEQIDAAFGCGTSHRAPADTHRALADPCSTQMDLGAGEDVVAGERGSPLVGDERSVVEPCLLPDITKPTANGGVRGPRPRAAGELPRRRARTG